jgi:PAS domain S-box-containing protein
VTLQRPFNYNFRVPGSPEKSDDDPRNAFLENDERFRLLVDSVKDYAIFMLDPRGVVATWNIGAQRIKGYRADEIVGQHFSRFYPEEDVRAGKCEMELERATAEGRFEDEGWRTRKDGSWFWANVVITVLRDTDENVVGFAKVTRDLTERRAAEDERLRLGLAARERIRALAELSEALAATLSIDEVARVVAERGSSFARGDACTLHLLDEKTANLELIAERGCNPTVLEHFRRISRDSRNPIYPVGAGTAPGVWVENAEQYDALLPSVARVQPAGQRVEAFWCVPLVAEGRTIGMMAVGFHQPHRFSDEEREFVGTFARQCAQALARARSVEAERDAAAVADRLRASLATTLRSIGDALIATDSNGRITLMNGVAERLTGWSEPEARGQPLVDVFHIVNEHTRAPVPDPVARVLQTGGIVGLSNHTVLLARGGHEIPIDDSGAPIRGESGTIDGVVLVFRDVIERKREEERRAFLADASTALTESLEYEQTLARVVRLAVPRLADWCALDLVDPAESIPKRLIVAHVDPAKVELAKEFHAKYPPKPEATTGLSNVLRTGRPELYPKITDELLIAGAIDSEHLRMMRKLDLRSVMLVPVVSRQRVLGAMSFVFAESGRTYTEADLSFAEELAQRCANAIENAGLYRSEQEARRAADVANGAKDQFLAMVSHELRTPLNAIMGWAKMLTSYDADEQRQKSALQTIERNAVAMAQLIEDLLDMSRVISGTLRIEVQPVALSRVIETALESIRPAAIAKKLDLVPMIDANVPALMGDPARLQQVVWNLLSNAVKFTPPGGRVEVMLRNVHSQVEISVKDTGKGIAPAFIPSVFEPFRQEDGVPSRSRGGLGLGLAISRQLVELHGGQIACESEGEGLGSTFTVTLPTAASLLPKDRTDRLSRQFTDAKSFERPDHIRGLRVLVVDDDDDARDLVAAVLEDCGCRVTTATNVADAMTVFTDDPPAVLLSDIGMPHEDGYDLIRKVRSLPRESGGDVPAAALTAYARAEDRQKILNAGYSIHVPKPIEPAELVAVVATLSRFARPRT